MMAPRSIPSQVDFIAKRRMKRQLYPSFPALPSLSFLFFIFLPFQLLKVGSLIGTLDFFVYMPLESSFQNDQDGMQMIRSELYSWINPQFNQTTLHLTTNPGPFDGIILCR